MTEGLQEGLDQLKEQLLEGLEDVKNSKNIRIIKIEMNKGLLKAAEKMKTERGVKLDDRPEIDAWFEKFIKTYLE